MSYKMQRSRKTVGLQWCVSKLSLMATLYVLVEVLVCKMKRRYKSNIPSHLVTASVCIVIGIFVYYVEPTGEDYQGLQHTPPQDILHQFMLFYTICTIYQIDLFLYTNTLPGVFMVCVIVLFVTSSMLCLAIGYIIHPEWEWTEVLLATLVLMPVLPCHAIVMLRALTRNKHAATILEVESIGIFAIIYIAFEYLRLLEGGYITGTWVVHVRGLTVFVFGGALTGYIVGKITKLFIGVLYNDLNSAICIILGFAQITFFGCQYFLQVSGNIAIIVLTYFLVKTRRIVTQDVDRSIVSFMKILQIMVETAALGLYVTETLPLVLSYSTFSVTCTALILYVTLNVFRLMVFGLFGFCMNKIVSNLDYGLRTGLILGYSGQKGSYNFLLMFILIHNPYTYTLGRTLAVEVLLLYVFTMIGNALPLRMVLRAIGFAQLSTARRQNMNLSLNHIMYTRSVIMQTMKHISFIGGSNWNKIRYNTDIKHPHTSEYINERNIGETGENDEIFHSNAAICPECLRRVPYELTEKDVEDLCGEARTKILKAKKIAINRHYKSGAINVYSVHLLLYNINLLLDERVQQSKLNMRSYLQPLAIVHFLHTCFSKYKGEKKVIPPDNAFQRYFFYLTHHILYDILLSVVVFGYAVYAIYYITELVDSNAAVCHCSLIGIFIIDFAFRLFGLANTFNCEQYLWLFWCLISLVVEITLLHEIMITTGITQYNLSLALRIATIARLSYLYLGCKSIAATIVNALDRRIDAEVSFGFEIVAALEVACGEVLDMLDQLLDVDLIREIYEINIQNEREYLISTMKRTQKERPWIVITIKTKQVIAATINVMHTGLLELKNAGYVDELEYEYIKLMLAERIKQFRTRRIMKPPSPRVIFNEVPWLRENPEIIEYLYETAITVRFRPGDIIMRDGYKAEGVYIVISGSLRLEYKEGARKSKMFEKYGFLPVVDYLSTTSYENDFEDDFTVGSTFGEKAILTSRRYNCNIYAESIVQAYMLLDDDIQEAIVIFNNPISGLKSKIWKYCNIDLAMAIIAESHLYRSLSQRDIWFKLDRAFVPRLRCYKVFVITEFMNDVLLLEGVAVDCLTKTMFKAPALIPKDTHKLYVSMSNKLYHDHDTPVETTLMIVPIPGKTAYEVMWHEEERAEIVSFTSQCVLHTKRQMAQFRMKQSENRSEYLTDKDQLDVPNNTDVQSPSEEFNWLLEHKKTERKLIEECEMSLYK